MCGRLEGVVELSLAGRGEHQRGVDGFRKDLSASYRLQRKGWGREAGDDAAVKVAPGAGESGLLPAKGRWL